MSKTGVFKRCSCTAPVVDGDGQPRLGPDGKPKRREVGAGCTRLADGRHGTWWFQLDLPAPGGQRRKRMRRGGYASRREAQDRLNAIRRLLSIAEPDDQDARQRIVELIEQSTRAGGEPPSFEDVRRRYETGQSLTKRYTVGQWLEEWIKIKRKIRPSTLRSYQAHIRLYLVPYLGGIGLDRLSVAQIQDLFDEIDALNEQVTESNARRRALSQSTMAATKAKERAARAKAEDELAALPPYRRTVGAATKQRIRATLRSALTTARRQGKITYNPAGDVELPAGKRPKALVWTDERVTRWRDTGERPSPVMVWTPEQTGAFLDHIAGDRLYALFHLIAFRGLRRGEACGLHLTEIDWKAQTLTVSWQIVQLGWQTDLSAPKSEAGHRVVALDDDTTAVLAAHRKQQLEERLAWGPNWTDTGLFFTRENGEALHPADVTARFTQLVVDAGLPPVRLHDLRHGAATLAFAAGADLKVVQEMLGHSSVVLTGDTYTSVLPEVARAAAEGTAALIRNARGTRARTVPEPPRRDGTGTEPERPRKR
jgi:integrase